LTFKSLHYHFLLSSNIQTHLCWNWEEFTNKPRDAVHSFILWHTQSFSLIHSFTKKVQKFGFFIIHHTADQWKAFVRYREPLHTSLTLKSSTTFRSDAVFCISVGNIYKFKKREGHVLKVPMIFDCSLFSDKTRLSTFFKVEATFGHACQIHKNKTREVNIIFLQRIWSTAEMYSELI